MRVERGNTACIVTFGCQMNEYDSLRIKEYLQSGGFFMVDNPEDADTIIVNTCSVRAKAEQKVLSYLGRLRKLPNEPRLVLAGCMAQTLEEEMLGKIPHVSTIVGPNNYAELPALLTRKSNKRAIATDEPKQPWDFVQASTVEPEATSAFVTIMKGCDNFCAYCIVPFARGPERSRPAHEIKEEIEFLVKNGVKDVTLLGQNVNSYNSHEQNMDFPQLLNYLCGIDGLQRIRFMTSHPKDISEALIHTIAHQDKLCEHIHLPLQAGSDHTLQNMNRGYTAADYYRKIEMIKSQIPNVRLTTDILVGFPEETDQDFEETISMIEKVRYDDLFVFAYSPRPHTKAAQRNDDVAYHEKVKRLQHVVNTQTPITQQSMEAHIGNSYEVLVEGQSRQNEERISGRTRGNVLVHFKQKLQPGDLVQATIKKAGTHSLHGVVD